MRAQTKSLRYETPEYTELGHIKNGVHTPKILPIATWIIIAQLLSNRNEILSPKAWKGDSHYIHCHGDKPVNCRSIDKRTRFQSKYPEQYTRND